MGYKMEWWRGMLSLPNNYNLMQYNEAPSFPRDMPRCQIQNIKVLYIGF